MDTKETIEFTSNNGEVTGYCGIFDECCGVTFLYLLRFYPTNISTKQNLYEDFLKALLDRDFGCSDDYEEYVAKYLICDVVGGDEYDFCMATKEHWDTSPPSNNPKTDRKVQVFELTPKELFKGDTPSHITEGDDDDDDDEFYEEDQYYVY